jgi:hypothetical protein
MDHGVLWKCLSGDIDQVTGVCHVPGRDLKTISAARTGNQQSFAACELVEALEHVDTAHGDSLTGTTRVTGVDDFAKEVAKDRGHGPIAIAVG